MQNSKKEKIYPKRSLHAESDPTTSFAESSPWKDAETAFNWINFDYPQYHKHADWEIFIVLNDKIVHSANGKNDVLYTGDACLICPKDVHAIFYPDRKKNDFQGVNFLAKDSYVKKLLGAISPCLYDELLSEKKTLYFNVPVNSLENYADVLYEIQTYEPNEYTEKMCNLVFSYLILDFLKQRLSTKNVPPLLKDFVKKLNDPSISREEIKELESNIPLSYCQLTRLFKKYMRRTITSYVNHVKLEYAKELLANTDLTVSQIVEELHFESPSYLHNLFKKSFGWTPLEYRRRNQSPSR